MSKKYKYYPDFNCDSKGAVREFATAIPVLEVAHRCPVRMVKARRSIFGFIIIIYELTKETTND